MQALEQGADIVIGTRFDGGKSGIRAIQDGLNVFKAIINVYVSDLPQYKSLHASVCKPKSSH
ncbi:hypothetical protein A3J19_02390 [Candidatus Daviesbacteria bacterium RIFCSPLOWO2_02_FULL_41_8]|uniref:Uncharacterized protein n=2 Tax=Candidatus Daviesiibacteriota TaxID=1752718 RepID=A0A1F5NIF7_9BACT|nr:MAG: hypothetical protein A3D83_01180 [Candidatus Daviesbacteria bacterium RIFCSPHIGHO2_02_FULL_41_10]OGE77449.1 MAG: hypothetical protein A3J19_02390 [Candidatus Daviesbacteria bacterium RIFCSPLOWO2_02_FULL_41_8]